MLLTESLLGTASSTAANYIEDVFSTYLYTGTGASLTITNGIDLSTKGGLVWLKSRSSGTGYHNLFDTNRGINKTIQTNVTDAEKSQITLLTNFNANGFTLGSDALGYQTNQSGALMASWTFRKQAKFFDVVTYTGNGTAGKTVAHNLGSVPGCIIIKQTNTNSNWFVYHRSIGNSQWLKLESTAAADSGGNAWNYTTPTSTSFTLGDLGDVNTNGAPYVAYLFAHNAGGFGASGADNVISCGSFTTSSGVSGLVNTGFEPQWVLIKRTDSATLGDWQIYDNMRGVVASNNGGTYAQSSQKILPNSSAAEATDGFGLGIYQQGFNFNNSSGTATYIYIAIRRGPMKTPTSGTSVFNPNTSYSTISSGIFGVTTGFPVDALWWRVTSATVYPFQNGFMPRLTGGRDLKPYSTDAEANNIAPKFDYNTQVAQQAVSSGGQIYWSFRRAPGFFDVVCYTGTGANRTVSHNLGVAPELMIVKRRNNIDDWGVYAGVVSNPATGYFKLNTNQTFNTELTYWNDTPPTSSLFTVGTNGGVNASGGTYVAYLFATVAGVSKVGSYTGTGTGTTKQIDCGFAGGARFVLIKRTDSTGDWYVWDSARGIVSGNDPYLLLNSTAAEVTNTDYIDTYAAGFEISSTAPAAINANGGSFIFLAIA